MPHPGSGTVRSSQIKIRLSNIYENYCLKPLLLISVFLLNQARAGRRPARAWFLEITFMRTSVCVRACVCVSAPRAIKNYSREMKSE